MRALSKTRLVNATSLPLVLYSGTTPGGVLCGEFETQNYLAILSAFNACVRRPRHISQSTWELIEPTCARRVQVALVEGRCAFLTPGYLKWTFNTITRHNAESHMLNWDKVEFEMSASDNFRAELPVWLTRGLNLCLANARRGTAVRKLLGPRAKKWGASTCLRKIFLREGASPASMNRPVFLDAEKPYEQALQIYSKLVFDQRAPEEPVERWLASMILQAAKVQAKVSGSSADHPDSGATIAADWVEAETVRPERIGRQLATMLRGGNAELQAVIDGKASTEYPELVDALCRIDTRAKLLPSKAAWELLAGALVDQLAAEVTDYSQDATQRGNHLVAWLDGLPSDFQRERPLSVVVAEILAMPLQSHAAGTIADEIVRKKRQATNVGIVARCTARGWQGAAMLAILPAGSLDREIVMALVTRRIGSDVVASLEQIRESSHFQQLSRDSVWGPFSANDIPDRLELLGAVSARLVEWKEVIWSLGRERGGDPSYVFEIPQAIMRAPQALGEAIEHVDLAVEAMASQKGRAGKARLAAPENPLVASAVNAARFSVAIERLCERQRDLFVDRRTQLNAAEAALRNAPA